MAFAVKYILLRILLLYILIVFFLVCVKHFCVYKSICFQNTPIFHKLIFLFSSKSFLIVFPNRITNFVVVIAVTVCLFSGVSVCAFYTGVAVVCLYWGLLYYSGNFSSFGLFHGNFHLGDGRIFKQFK